MHTKDGLDFYCKSCRNEKHNRYLERSSSKNLAAQVEKLARLEGRRARGVTHLRMSSDARKKLAGELRAEIAALRKKAAAETARRRDE